MSDRITIRLDERMKMIIEGIATTERKSASQIIRDALYEYLKAIEEKG
jgi:predicted transcriptional regulator